MIASNVAKNRKTACPNPSSQITGKAMICVHFKQPAFHHKILYTLTDNIILWKINNTQKAQVDLNNGASSQERGKSKSS